MRLRLFALWFALLSIAAGPPELAAQTRPPGNELGVATIEDSVLPAEGRQATIFRVPSFGRWSVALASERGVALQLVDRVNGPSEIVGVPGEVDGRLDLFLDRGDYRVVSHGVEARSEDMGEAVLTVRPFREAEERAVTLPDLAEVATDLADLEQVSWWVLLEEKQRVAFEAAGRHLEDLRLCRDGSWMVGAEPTFEQTEPVVGRPLTLARLAAELPAGLYRLTAYGGVGLPWSDDDGSRPLYLRSGIPRRGEAGRSRLAVSSFGIDRFVVPASASFYRLEVPEGDLRADTVSFRVGDWAEETPYSVGNGPAATVHKELRELAVEHFRSVNENGQRVITVRGAADQPYVLQHFRREPIYRFHEEGEYWIDTVHSGHPADAVEATAMLFDTRQISRYVKPLRAEVVELRSTSRLHRRFNLHESATMFLEVVEGGDYRLGLDGVEAEIRLEPYLLPGQTLEERPPSRHLEPGDVTDWRLDPGYYVLTLEPEAQGIADLTLSAASGSGSGSDEGAAPTARIGRIFLDEASYLLHQNEQPGIRSGIVLRPLPLDLSEPLPFVLSGRGDRASLTVPFRVPGPGVLRAESEDGTELLLGTPAGAGEPAPTTLAVSTDGTVTVSAATDLERPVAVSLFWEPEHRNRPLPELPAGTLEALPALPVLAAEQDRFLELHRTQSETFLVRAEEAALYRLESTGLLDTVGVLRTRVVPSLERTSDGGTGRNFQIQRYLGAGEYQLTVQAAGRSSGPLGVRLAATRVRPAGRLEGGVAARGWIDPHESLEYRFRVEDPGRWRIRVLGLGGLFPVRIEDADGWPVTRPARPGDQTVELDAGEYRLVVLPHAVRSRHVALVEEIPGPVEREGHGPFELALGETVEHRWQEPTPSFRSLVEREAELPADRWRFRLSAPVELQVELSRDVIADLVRPADGQVLGRVTTLRGLDGAVPAGEYELHIRPARQNNRIDYRLLIEPRQLLPGYSRTVQVPGTYRLVVGEPSLIETATFGSLDVRARLLDTEGRALAQSDDRPGDWNLRLVRRLEPGEYQLEVASSGDGGAVDLTIAALDQEIGSPLDLRQGVAQVALTPGRSVHYFPLEVPSEGVGAVMARAVSEEGVRLTLELDHGQDGWHSVAFGEGRTARLAYVPVSGRFQDTMLLRLEAVDRGSSNVEISAVWIGDRVASEERLAKGIRVRDDLGGRGMVAVSLDRPGCFDVSQLDAGVRAAGFTGSALRAAPDLVAARDTLWLAGPAGREIRASRWTWPAHGEARRLRLLPGERATCDLVASDELRLLSARGLGEQATLTVGDGGAEAADGAEALALALPRAGTATIGLGNEVTDSLAPPAEVELRSRSFREAQPGDARAGVAGQIEPGDSRAFVLPAGPHCLRMTLGAGVTAAIATGRDVDLLHRASREGVDLVREIRPADDGVAYLRILGPESSARLYDVAVLDRVDPPANREGVLFEQKMQRAGVLDVEVEPRPSAPDETYVRVHGARRVTFLGADGSVAMRTELGTRLPVPPAGGRLVIEHEPGYLMARLEEAGLSPAAEVAEQARSLTLPSVQPLDSTRASFALDLDRPRVVHLRAPTPALVSIRASGETRIELDSVHLSVDVWLPAGQAIVELLALAGHSLGGELEVVASDVVEVTEGLGPELLLAPGSTRYASFEVRRAGQVGVGVRADAEVVAVHLLDSQRARRVDLGDGVMLMDDLKPGRYLMTMSLPADHPPVRVRPVVVGLEPPTGPPEDVVQRYLALAGETSSPGEAP
ncbi:MAG: hypothetical protein MPN21_11115 [Thermoanaerobaculia bacterium]|nr:hypothetical protein [Thermoanaerobaculia bacterium]